jgi:hypothetical protein
MGHFDGTFKYVWIAAYDDTGWSCFVHIDAVSVQGDNNGIDSYYLRVCARDSGEYPVYATVYIDGTYRGVTTGDPDDLDIHLIQGGHSLLFGSAYSDIYGSNLLWSQTIDIDHSNNFYNPAEIYMVDSDWTIKAVYIPSG